MVRVLVVCYTDDMPGLKSEAFSPLSVPEFRATEAFSLICEFQGVVLLCSACTTFVAACSCSFVAKRVFK
jgi:hypothetical protein